MHGSRETGRDLGRDEESLLGGGATPVGRCGRVLPAQVFTSEQPAPLHPGTSRRRTVRHSGAQEPGRGLGNQAGDGPRASEDSGLSYILSSKFKSW